jgi:hypothetical protein
MGGVSKTAFARSLNDTGRPPVRAGLAPPTESPSWRYLGLAEHQRHRRTYAPRSPGDRASPRTRSDRRPSETHGGGPVCSRSSVSELRATRCPPVQSCALRCPRRAPRRPPPGRPRRRRETGWVRHRVAFPPASRRGERQVGLGGVEQPSDELLEHQPPREHGDDRGELAADHWRCWSGACTLQRRSTNYVPAAAESKPSCRIATPATHSAAI